MRTRSGGQILLIPINEIRPNPDQPRRSFNMQELQSLAESIRQNGIIQPVTVRLDSDGYYELISGERRLRASKMIGLARLPCIVMEATDEKSATFALLENLQRQDLSFFEEATAIDRLMRDYSLTQEQIAIALGKTQSAVSNKLRLLRLRPDMRAMIAEHDLTERHARALLRISDEDKRRKALKKIIEKQMNVKQTEDFITALLEVKPVKRKKDPSKLPIKLYKDIRLFVNTIDKAVDSMRLAGMEAKATRKETNDYYEYVVRIAKKSSTKSDVSRETGLWTESTTG